MELPEARLALYELISMLPPFSTIGCVNAPALPMRSSVSSPRVLSEAPGVRVKKPRVPFGTGASAPMMFSNGNSAAKAGENAYAVKLRCPPGALSCDCTLTFAPLSVMEPCGKVVSGTPAGTRTDPS